MGQEQVLFHFVALGDDKRGAVELGQDPDARAATETARRVQGRFLGFKERLEPLEGVLVLKDAVPGTDNAEDFAVS
jgi:hypothetical protein